MPNLKNAQKALVSVPHRSGFDKSFRNLFTAKCGTLVPILCDEVIPNTSVYLDLALSVAMPPMATETFMNVDYKVEAFFVPTRLLMVDYERWLSDFETTISVDSGSGSATLRPPVALVSDTDAKPGSLMDYLGFRLSSLSPSGDEVPQICAFPMLAYHKIWDDWYRNSLIQRSIYRDRLEAQALSLLSYNAANSKFVSPVSGENIGYLLQHGDDTIEFADGSTIFDLRQRNFGTDYFTSATQSPQKGDAQKVSMSLPTGLSIKYGNGGVLSGFTDPVAPSTSATSNAGYFNGVNITPSYSSSASAGVSFTIASLRAANSMQMFLERNNIAGNRLVDYVKAQYGANLKDSIAQRPVYLGSASFNVYNKGVYQSAQASSSNNPFTSVGARYGNAYAEGSTHLIEYTAEEPGYIMVIGSLVPRVTYASGVSRMLTRYTTAKSQSDMANPILQNVGPQPIYLYELDPNNLFGAPYGSDAVFGYVDRFADWMTKHDELHGLIRDGEDLEAFALQRYFNSDTDPDTPGDVTHNFVGINNRFLQIPTNYMDQVTAVSSDISTYGVWVDSYLNYKVSMPLHEYSVPSLQDPAWEHGNVFEVDRAGKHID